MDIYHQILKNYWGYDSFRELQLEIIKSVVEQKKDTLGLLPTGGGKSIIFQVPGIILPGTCLVISPLIALMKDQVENLKKRNIAAEAIYTGMTQREISYILTKAAEGNLKFLYVSPERLSSKLFLNYLPHIKINLLAVDEAHCISQWGYDFRPSYLEIAKIRDFLPNVNVLALTASATQKVIDDIQEKLKFPEKNFFKKSFERKNLIYIVKKVNNKTTNLLNLLKILQGSGIIYVRSRQLTQNIAKFLIENYISADFYHAGIPPKDKERKQNLWKNNEIRVIVATNAFGMGIDKPDVRFVIHYDLPDSLESYYQEAGRGGRDGANAYAILLYNDEDIEKLRSTLKQNFPPKELIKKIYDTICNYFQVPIGTGQGHSFEFNLSEFSEKYRLNSVDVFNSLKILQKEGLLEYSTDLTTKSELHINVKSIDLYKFQIENPKYEPILKNLVRLYPGLFSSYVEIDEFLLSKASNQTIKETILQLRQLHDLEIIDYIKAPENPYITLISERVDVREIRISPENYELLQQMYSEKIESVIDYVTDNQTCRSVKILKYFDETAPQDCKKCDVCIQKEKIEQQEKEIRYKILKTLEHGNFSIKELALKLNYNTDEIEKVVKKLIDENKVEFTHHLKIKLSKK